MTSPSDDVVPDADIRQAETFLQSVVSTTSEIDAQLDNFLELVKSQGDDMSQGLSFLEMKNQTMLSYLINLGYLFLKKVSGSSIKDDAAVFRLAELRTVLEKIRPIEQKLKYQIDKLIRTAALGAPDESDPLRFKANPEEFGQDDEEEESESEDDEEEKDSAKSKIYVPPKLAAVHYDGDMTAAEKKEKQMERARKRAMSSSVVQELQAQYGEAPEEIRDTRDRMRPWEAKRAKDIQEYEEKFFTRMSLSKREKSSMKQRRRQSEMSGLTNFGDFTSLIGNDELPEERGSSKKKRKLGGKGKKGKKGFKKRKR